MTAHVILNHKKVGTWLSHFFQINKVGKLGKHYYCLVGAPFLALCIGAFQSDDYLLIDGPDY